MAISYAKVSKTQYIFRQLTGLTREEFEKIVEKSGQNGKKRKNRKNVTEQPIQRPKDSKKRKKSYSGKKKMTTSR